MKSPVIIIILFLMPLFASAQSIEKSGIDEFTGKPVVYTSWAELKSKGIFPAKKSVSMKFMLRYVDGKVFFCLIWNESINRIKKDSELLLKTGKGPIITLRAVDDFSAYINVYSYLDHTYTRYSMQAMYEGDFPILEDNDFVDKIRLNTIYGPRDFELNVNNVQSIPKAYKLIDEEIKKID